MRQLLLLLPLAATVACGTVTTPDEAVAIADEQVSTGQVILPTAENPIVYGPGAVQYLYCGLRDGGCYDESGMDFRGISGEFVVNWKPGNGAAIKYGTYTPEGSMFPTFVAVYPYPSSARGGVADLDAVAVDWATVDETGIGTEQGVNDGWLNIDTSMFGVANVDDCGYLHPNMLLGFDDEGDYDTFRAAAAVSLGTQYCDDWVVE